MPKPPPVSTRNPAFQSRLERTLPGIHPRMRAKRWSYPRIAAVLREIHGLNAAPAPSFPSSKFAPSGAGSTRSRRRTIRQFSNPPQ